MALDLTSIRGVLLDMDGVLWRSTDVIPGAPEFIAFLRQRGIPYGLATNNSSRSVDDYVTRCANFGIPVEAEQIVTSAVVTADEMARQYPPGTPIYIIGGSGLITLLTSRGYIIDPDAAKVIVVGLDAAITYEKLTHGLRCLLRGADFIGTNGDATFPVADGLAPGAGSLIAALQTASGRTARLMGKPQPEMFSAALRRLGSAAENTLMIGDRLDTDILGAQQSGFRTALVLSGVSQRGDIGTITPDAVYDDLRTLHTDWAGTR